MKYTQPKLFEDGNVSPQWRVAFPESLSDHGWLRRTDYWPVGITVKPGVDPKEVRQQVAEELSWPAGERLDGSHLSAITYQIDEIRLVDCGT